MLCTVYAVVNRRSDTLNRRKITFSYSEIVVSGIYIWYLLTKSILTLEIVLLGDLDKASADTLSSMWQLKW